MHAISHACSVTTYYTCIRYFLNHFAPSIRPHSQITHTPISLANTNSTRPPIRLILQRHSQLKLDEWREVLGNQPKSNMVSRLVPTFRPRKCHVNCTQCMLTTLNQVWKDITLAGWHWAEIIAHTLHLYAPSYSTCSSRTPPKT